jgi:hypothetical protein
VTQELPSRWAQILACNGKSVPCKPESIGVTSFATHHFAARQSLPMPRGPCESLRARRNHGCETGDEPETGASRGVVAALSHSGCYEVNEASTASYQPRDEYAPVPRKRHRTVITFCVITRHVLARCAFVRWITGKRASRPAVERPTAHNRACELKMEAGGDTNAKCAGSTPYPTVYLLCLFVARVVMERSVHTLRRRLRRRQMGNRHPAAERQDLTARCGEEPLEHAPFPPT